MRKKVVTIGGGSGSFNLLKGLKKYAKRTDEDDSIDITFIASSTDSGGSSGRLRDEYGMLPPGDMRQGLVALSDAPDDLKWMFGYESNEDVRFNNKNSGLYGHHLGNLIFTKFIEKYGEDEAYRRLHKVLQVRGTVIPSTKDKAHITGKYENGTTFDREHIIDKFPNPDGKKIDELFSDKKINANPEALKALANADAIIIGPGDLYTSIICNLLSEDIVSVIKKSKAVKVYNCNIVTKPSETPNYSVMDHINDLEKYLGKGVIDFVTYNTDSKIDSSLLERYKKENKYPVRFIEDEFKDKKVRVIGRELVSEHDILRHDSEKLSKLIIDDIIFPL
jgi:uncharacterized cofD-like protein